MMLAITSAAELAPMMSIFAAIAALAAAAIPVIWDAFDSTDDEALDEQQGDNAEAKRLWDALRSQIPSLADTPFEEVTPDLLMQMPQLAGVEADPQVIGAQRQALQKLAQMGEGGMSDIERAAFDQAGREAGTRIRGQREAVLQNRQARGLGGSQDELQALLQGQQQAAELENQRQVGIQGQAMQRALGALGQYGQLAGQMRGQSFSEGAARARAVDDFNRYNTDYRRGVQGRNVDRMTNARQQQFANRASVAAGMTGQYNRSADQAEQRYRDTQARDDQRLAAGIGAGAAAYRYFDEDDDDEYSPASGFKRSRR